MNGKENLLRFRVDIVASTTRSPAYVVARDRSADNFRKILCFYFGNYILHINYIILRRSSKHFAVLLRISLIPDTSKKNGNRLNQRRVKISVAGQTCNSLGFNRPITLF